MRAQTPSSDAKILQRFSHPKSYPDNEIITRLYLNAGLDSSYFFFLLEKKKKKKRTFRESKEGGKKRPKMVCYEANPHTASLLENSELRSPEGLHGKAESVPRFSNREGKPRNQKPKEKS